MEKRYFTVSASSLTTLQACETKYLYSHLMRLVPMRLEIALDFGGLLHFMLHPYYFNRIREPKPHHLSSPLHPILALTPKQAMDACLEIGKAKALATDLSADDRMRAFDLFINYAQFHTNDGWITKEVEQPFSRVIYEDDELVIIYVGKVDLIAEVPVHGECLIDHKTGGRDTEIPDTNNQIVGSCFAFDKTKFIINKALSRKDNPFVGENHYISTEQKEEWLRDTIHHVKRMIHYIDNDYYPMNRASCGSFGKCRYLNICKCPASARDVKIEGLYKKSNHVGLYEEDPVAEKIYAIVLGSKTNEEQTAAHS